MLRLNVHQDVLCQWPYTFASTSLSASLLDVHLLEKELAIAIMTADTSIPRRMGKLTTSRPGVHLTFGAVGLQALAHTVVIFTQCCPYLNAGGRRMNVEMRLPGCHLSKRQICLIPVQILINCLPSLQHLQSIPCSSLCVLCTTSWLNRFFPDSSLEPTHPEM